MKAKRYKVRVCDGMLDHVHGNYHAINELCVPEIGLYINDATSFVNLETKNRVPEVFEEIELDGGDVAAFVELARNVVAKESLESNLRDKFLPNGKGEFSRD